MSTLNEGLRNIFDSKLVMDLIPENNMFKAVMTEPKNKDNPNSTYEVTVKGIDARSILIALDLQETDIRFSALFNAGNGDINKKCDYALLTKYGDKIYLIFFEMKSRRVNYNEVYAQLTNSKYFLDYVHTLCVKYYFGSVLGLEVNVIFVLFCQKENRTKLNISRHDGRKFIRYINGYNGFVEIADNFACISWIVDKYENSIQNSDRLYWGRPE